MLIPVSFSQSLMQTLVTYLQENPGCDYFGWGRTQIILPTQRLGRHGIQLLTSQNRGRPFILPQFSCLMDLPEPAGLDLLPKAPLSLVYGEINRALTMGKTLPGLQGAQKSDLLPQIKHLLDTLFFHDMDIPEFPFPDLYAAHWAQYGELFQNLKPMVSQSLESQGFMYPAQRVHRIWEATAKAFENNPPKDPVILCGVLGTYPAEQHLVNSIQKMDSGVVILQGLEDENLYPWLQNRPVFQSISSHTPIETIETQTLREEAESIALLCHHRLSTNQEKLVIVTPDGTLKTCIQSALKARGIYCDDSQGTPWVDTTLGQMLKSLAQLSNLDYPLTNLLDLLKNPYTTFGPYGRETILSLTHFLEAKILRAHHRIEDLYTSFTDKIKDSAMLEIQEFIGSLALILSPYLELKSQAHVSFGDLLKAFRSTWLEVFKPDSLNLSFDEERLLEQLIQRMDEVQAFAHRFGTIQPAQFFDLLLTLLKDVTMTTTFSHPRLRMIVPQEVIALQDEIVIMAGCQRDQWQKTSHGILGISDTLLSLMGIFVNKSLEETYYQQIALRRENIILTRSQTRLGEFVHGAAFWETLTPRMIQDPNGYNRLLNLNYTHLPPKGIDIPAPSVPLSERPKDLSVSDVGLLVANPYIFYAQKILRIQPLESLTPHATPALYGTFIHELLEKAVIASDLNTLIQSLASDKRFPALWILRAQKILNILKDDQTWLLGPNLDATHIENEVFCKHPLNLETGTLSIRGRMDRLYQGPSSAWVVDYKSGQIPTKTSLESGTAPQLPLLAKLLNLSRGIDAQGAYLSLKNGTWTTFTPDALKAGLENVCAFLTAYLAPEFQFQAVEDNPFHEFETFQRTKTWGRPC